MPYTIKADIRTETGKSKVKKLRRAGMIPAVTYGHGDPSVLLSLGTKELGRLLDEISGHSPIVELETDGSLTKCVIKTIQRNPIDGSLLHVDFQKVHPHEKITIHVPVVIRGSAEGVKAGGMLDHLMREVPVRAPIDKIPEHFDIDVTHLKLGQSHHISDLKAEGIEFTLPLGSPIVTVLAPRKLTETQVAVAAAPAAEAAAEAEPKEPVVIREKKAKEKEEPPAEKK